MQTLLCGASHNCSLPLHCLKCAQPHLTYKCTKKDHITPTTCCDHPTNYKHCPANPLNKRNHQLFTWIKPPNIRLGSSAQN